MLYLSLLCFLLLGILIICAIKNKYLKIILAVIFEFFFFLDLTAIFTKATHIDYAFVANIEKSIITVMFTVFLKEVILMTVLIILFNYIGIKLLKKYENRLSNIKYKYLILLLVVINFSKIGVVYSIYKTADQTVLASENLNLEENLRAVGINPKDYVLKDDIKAEPGKNVVIIYLESLEKNYLDNELFDNITPNLNKLRKEWSFYDYQDDSYWTMGAMYTTQTGLPPWYGHGNATFQNITKTNFPSIGTVLNKAGYNQIFMNGASLSYAGKGNFFKEQGYKCYGNEEYDEKYLRNSWGLRDKDLFEEAKKKYIELSDKNKPFNLTLLTVDTHFPKGLPDDRLENLVKTKEKNMEYCVEANDYLIGDFIEFLKKQPNYGNLAIYILTDHKVMGNETGSPITKKLNKKPRDLFLLTNQKSIPEYENINQKLYFYDIPKIILNGAEIKTNTKFMKDLISDISVEYFKEKINHFSNLNLSLLDFDSIENGIKVDINNGKIILKSKKKIIDKFEIVEKKIKYWIIDKNGKVKVRSSTLTNNEKYYITTDYILRMYFENKKLILDLIDQEKNVYLKKDYEIGRKILSFGKYSLYKEGINISKKQIKNLFYEIEIKNNLDKQKNLNSYLRCLKSLNDKNIIVIVSVKDESSRLYLSYNRNLNNLGARLDLSNKSRWSYLGIFDTAGKNYYEKLENKKIHKKLKIKGINLELVSAGFKAGNVSSIKVNNVDYSQNLRGLNFVVINKETKNILDSFNVDTYADKELKIHKK